MNGGTTTNMFTSLTTSNITTEATAMAANFSTPILVAIGVGLAFACTRFVVGLFY